MNQTERTWTVLDSPGLAWVKDKDSNIIINEGKGEVHVLKGLDGMVWSWLCLGYDFHRLAGLFAVALDLSLTEAETQLDKLFQDWIQMGLLCREWDKHG